MSANRLNPKIFLRFILILFYISFSSDQIYGRYGRSDDTDFDLEPDPVCAEHPDSGVGPKLLHEWYFCVVISQCREFVYRGQGGNGNRFQSLQDCEHRCMREFVEGAQESGPKIKAPVNHRMKEVKKHLSYRLTEMERDGDGYGSRGHESKRRSQRKRKFGQFGGL